MPRDVKVAVPDPGKRRRSRTPANGGSGHHASGSVPSYIADLCSGMVRMAANAHYDTLAYLLEMAQMEAEKLDRGTEKEDRSKAEFASPPPQS